VDELCAKTIAAAEKWAPVADKLWEERQKELASKNPSP
jgi:hypothetical protein